MSGLGFIIKIIFYLIIFIHVSLILSILFDQNNPFRKHENFYLLFLIFNLYFLLKSRGKTNNESLVTLWIEVQKKKLKDQLKK